MAKIFVYVMHQVNRASTHRKCSLQHCLTSLYARHHGGTFIIRIEDHGPEANHVEDGERSQQSLRWLGMDWDPETHETTANQSAWNSIKNTLTNSWRKEKPTNLTLQKKSWQRNVNAKKQLKHLATSTDTLAWAKKKKSSLSPWRQEAAGIIPTVRLAVNESRYLQIAWWSKATSIEFGGNISQGLVIQRKMAINYNCRCDRWPRHAISHVIRGDDHIANTPKQLMVYEALGVRKRRVQSYDLIINWNW